MSNKFTLLAFLFLNSISVSYSQSSVLLNGDKPKSKTVSDTIRPRDIEKNYNFWSVNFNSGVNIGVRPFSEGYNSNPTNFFKDYPANHFDLNVRKMFNTNFGVALELAYDNFSNVGNSPKFSNNMYKIGAKGVFNLHRLMKWEEFTEIFGLQFNFGGGFSFLESPKSTTFENYDNIFTLQTGATLMFKLSNDFSANFNYTYNSNISHHVALDGQSYIDNENGRTGSFHTASVGIAYYFGKNDIHADWYYENVDKKTELDEMMGRIEELETMMNDSDTDGVPDYLDRENNTIGGVAVDTKGRAVDLNSNGVPDELESYLNEKYGNIENKVNNSISLGGNSYSADQMKSMINNDFVNVFFDFDNADISNGSLSAINFIIKYLTNDVDSKLTIYGFADNIGNKDYNYSLSKRRAEKVMEIIVASGIDANRLNIVVQGVDDNYSNSKLIRKLARRVSFKIE